MPVNYSGDRTKVTVDQLLKQPKALEQLILPEKLEFLTDLIFSQGTTGDSGSVEYGVTAKQVEEARAGIVEEGAPIPSIDVADMDKGMAVAEELGLGYHVTDKARRRNQGWVVEQGNRKVQKGLLRANAGRAMAAMNSAVTKYDLEMPAVGTGGWAAGKNLRATIVAAANRGIQQDWEYNMNTILVNPITANNILLLDDYANLAPREKDSMNPWLNPTLNGVLGLNWMTSTLVDTDTAYIFEPKTMGVNLTEIARYVDVERQNDLRQEFVFGLESSVPVITDPYALLKITGING